MFVIKMSLSQKFYREYVDGTSDFECGAIADEMKMSKRDQQGEFHFILFAVDDDSSVGK